MTVCHKRQGQGNKSPLTELAVLVLVLAVRGREGCDFQYLGRENFPEVVSEPRFEGSEKESCKDK